MKKSAEWASARPPIWELQDHEKMTKWIRSIQEDAIAAAVDACRAAGTVPGERNNERSMGFLLAEKTILSLFEKL